VGAGHVPEEYELLTGDFPARGRHTDEAVSALARAFTSEFPELPGPRFPASGMGLAPRPVRQPRPPIWIGGSSPAAIRRTAVFGDGWLPQGTRRRDLAEQIAQLRRWREELRGGAPIDIGTIVEPIHLKVGVSDWTLPGYVLSGGADEIAESLRELVAMGVNHLQVRFMARSVEEFCEQTAAFGAEVGPLLAP
jgi:alkanesulfonate monooxygenase SsuD/methylene tetrahydromethanopterin reductase-like flavin-dependent oxidoreductase (luciferase family)